MTLMTQKRTIKNFFKSKGEIVYQPIALDELNMEHYQRRTRYGKVRNIIKDFNPFLLGVILVSYRDGKYNVVDGGHRVAALKQMGAKTVMCQMVYGLTYEQEASLFLDFNCNRTGLTPNEKFAGAVEAKRKSALDIVSCLDKYGFTYNKSNTSKTDNMIAAVSTLNYIYNTTGKTGLMNLCRIIRKIWNGDKNSLCAHILKGMHTFLYNYDGKFNEDVLVAALEKSSPTDIVLEASRMTNSTLFTYRTQRGSSHIALIIRNLYNEEAKRYRTPKLANVFDC